MLIYVGCFVLSAMYVFIHIYICIDNLFGWRAKLAAPSLINVSSLWSQIIACVGLFSLNTSVDYCVTSVIAFLMLGSILTRGSFCGRSGVVKDWETLWFRDHKGLIIFQLFHYKCLWHTQYSRLHFIKEIYFIMDVLCHLIHRWPEMQLHTFWSYWPPRSKFSHDLCSFSLFFI